VFTIAGERVAGQTEPVWLQTYENGIQLFRRREFAQAAARFEESARQQSLDGLSSVLATLQRREEGQAPGEGDALCQLYLGRSRELLAHPPGADWNGVYVMTEK
jgi:hypothetical protein